MTLQDTHDLFVVRYKMEVFKRGLKEMRLPVKIIANFLSQAMSEIQRVLKPVNSDSTITLTGATEYTLATDMGEMRYVKYIASDSTENSLIKETKEYIDGLTADERTDTTPQRYAYYREKDGWKIKFDSNASSGTLYYYYFPDYTLYYPGMSAPSWGSFDGTLYSGNLPLPDRYVEAIILHMLYKFFGDMLPLYDREVSNLRSSAQETSKSEMKYKLGGY